MRKIVLTLLVLLPISVFCQRKWETGLAVKIDKLNYIRNYNLVADLSTGLELSKLWYKESVHVFSLVKEFGLSLNYSPIDYSYGGMGAGGSVDGFIVRTVAFASVIPQVRIRKTFYIQAGPRIEGLVAGYRDIIIDSWGMPGFNCSSGRAHHSGFSRDYFNDIYYGLSLRILKTINKKKVGISTNFMRTKETDEEKETDKTLGFAINYYF